MSVGEDHPNDFVVGVLGESEGSQHGRDVTLLGRAESPDAIALVGNPITVGELRRRLSTPAARARFRDLKAEDTRLRAMSDTTCAIAEAHDFDELVAWAKGGGARDAYAHWRRKTSPNFVAIPAAAATAAATAAVAATAAAIPLPADDDDDDDDDDGPAADATAAAADATAAATATCVRCMEAFLAANDIDVVDSDDESDESYGNAADDDDDYDD